MLYKINKQTDHNAINNTKQGSPAGPATSYRYMSIIIKYNKKRTIIIMFNKYRIVQKCGQHILLAICTTLSFVFSESADKYSQCAHRSRGVVVPVRATRYFQMTRVRRTTLFNATTIACTISIDHKKIYTFIYINIATYSPLIHKILMSIARSHV